MASLARLTAKRAVHLRITPRPSNLGESQEILRLISQFGEVEYFKNLKYDPLPAPNTTIVIYKDEDAAQTCLQRSPIRFRMGLASEHDEASSQPQRHEREPELLESAAASDAPQRSSRGPTGAPFGLGQARSMSTASSDLPRPPRKEAPLPFIGDDEPTSKPVSRIFQLQAHPARINFRNHIDTSHYHGSFVLGNGGAIQDDLAKRVPIAGLSSWDWRGVEKPWRVLKKEREREMEGSSRRKSLRELYDEGPGAGETEATEATEAGLNTPAAWAAAEARQPTEDVRPADETTTEGGQSTQTMTWSP